jgi:hypothetical protein
MYTLALILPWESVPQWCSGRDLPGVQDPSDCPSVGSPRVPELATSCFAWQAELSSKVDYLPTVEAWKVAGGKLLWWPDGSLLRRWGRGMVELLLLLLLWLLLLELSRLELWVIASILLLLLLTQLTPRWGIHHAIL